MLIFNALTLQVVNIVQAHKTSVSNISINSEGTMLATASDKVITHNFSGVYVFCKVFV